MTLDNLPRNHFKAILADPPWRWESWGGRHAGTMGSRDIGKNYDLIDLPGISALPISEIAADDCALFLWATWPMLLGAIEVIEGWKFKYSTCAFVWTKAHAGQIEMFQDHIEPFIGLGYWTRANTEPCLLATRGSPKRLNRDVRQAIIEPRREHSRKPDCVYERIERLVEGPYLELFARTERKGWTSWGNEVGKFKQVDGQHALSL